MSSDINQIDKPRTNPGDAIDEILGRSVRSWKFAFFIVLGVLVLQNVFLSLKPKQLYAVENGKIVGEVIFDEARYRSPDTVLADLKQWTAGCVSVNKNTIVEDLTVCLNHMSDELYSQRLTELEASDYINIVENKGCVNDDYQFIDSETGVTEIDRNSYLVKAVVKGVAICNDGGTPLEQNFYYQAEAKVQRRTESRPLALEVIRFNQL